MKFIFQIIKALFMSRAQNPAANEANTTPAANAATGNALKDATDELLQNAAQSAINGAGGVVKGVAGTATAAIAPAISSALLPILGGIALAGAVTGAFFGIRACVTKELTIDQTANVVEKIKEISEFTTACYYEEVVLKNSKVEAGQQNKLMQMMHVEADSVRSEVVIVAKGRVRAGYDLSKVPAEQIKVSGDSISIVLPQPEVFDVIVNPSDYEIYVEEGKWSHEEISALQADYRAALTVNSQEAKLLEKADKNGQKRLTMFLQAMGFSYVDLIKSN